MEKGAIMFYRVISSDHNDLLLDFYHEGGMVVAEHAICASPTFQSICQSSPIPPGYVGYVEKAVEGMGGGDLTLEGWEPLDVTFVNVDGQTWLVEVACPKHKVKTQIEVNPVKWASDVCEGGKGFYIPPHGLWGEIAYRAYWDKGVVTLAPYKHIKTRFPYRAIKTIKSAVRDMRSAQGVADGFFWDFESATRELILRGSGIRYSMRGDNLSAFIEAGV
jgi:hypothetical protein